MRLDLDAPTWVAPAGPASTDPLDALGDEPAATAAGTQPGEPLQIPVADIEEDPLQPRTEFEPTALQELAATVADRGVRSPVSVRSHPRQSGRWMLNYGARRLRASKMAGKATIPAFVDEAADSYDQVIENEQREGLKPLELALFVQRKMASGDSQADIARRMGKGRAYVTLATALIDAPDWMMAAYREGRCRGLRELYELRQLHARLGTAVAAWARALPAITWTELAAFKAAHPLADSIPAGDASMTEIAPTSEPAGAVEAARPQPPDASAMLTKPRTSIVPTMSVGATLVIEAEVDGRAVELVLDCLPSDLSMLFVRESSADRPTAVHIDAVTLRRVLRRV